MITPRKFVPTLLTVFVCLSLLASAEPQKPTTHHRSRKHQQSEPALPPYTPQKLTPLPLEQVPPVPPQVSYTNGQLTIVAHNSTLGDVLRAVHKQTGADVDLPSNLTDRVVTDLGPGPARDVLTALLNGSHFDYVMLGSPADPTHIERLVLTARSTPETASAGPPPAQPPAQMPNRFGQTFNSAPAPQAQAEEPEPQPDDNADATDDNATDQTADDNATDQQGQPQTPKTPEQLLQELQRQQQMNQQLNQQMNRNGQPQVVYPNGLPNPNQPETGNAPEQ